MGIGRETGQPVSEENPVNSAFQVWPELFLTLLFVGVALPIPISLWGAVSSSVKPSFSALLWAASPSVVFCFYSLSISSFYLAQDFFCFCLISFFSFFETLSVNVLCFPLCYVFATCNLLGHFHVFYSILGFTCDSADKESAWVWSLGWEDPLEKGKATHSSILAWRIPWTL